MSLVNLRKAKIDTLIAEYILKADAWMAALEAADSRTANKASDRVQAVYRELIQRGEDARMKLLDLLEHNNPRVRLWAASHALRFHPKEGERVLNVLLAEPPGLIKATAAATLYAWRNGTYRFP